MWICHRSFNSCHCVYGVSHTPTIQVSGCVSGCVSERMYVCVYVCGDQQSIVQVCVCMGLVIYLFMTILKTIH